MRKPGAPAFFAGDERGTTLLEFALILPALCLVLMASFDIGHTLYTRAMLEGVVQKTGRDFSLEDAASSQAERDELDAKVLKQARALVNNADIQITRRFYRTFSKAKAKKPEDWSDTNKNNKCDNGEPYQDANQNDDWDKDGGDEGVGGAKDAVVYTVTMTYKHMFPVTKLLGIGSDTKVSASTILRNQPYGEQGNYSAPVVRNCK